MAKFSEKAETKRLVIECNLLRLYNRNKILCNYATRRGATTILWLLCRSRSEEKEKLSSAEAETSIGNFHTALFYVFHFNHLTDAFY